MLRLERLRHDYGDLCALAEIDLQVPRGAIFGLVGPNGAGKTTLLKIVGAIQEPTYGVVSFCERPVSFSDLNYKRRIGLMPDFFLQYDDLLVWEYLDYFAAAQGVAAADRPTRISKLLRQVDLQSKREAFVGELSRGMRQRVEFARAIVHEPELLLLDEPASGLDPLGRKKLFDLLWQEHETGRTIIISSHILQELAPVCTDIALMEKGRITHHGPISTLAQQVKKPRRMVIETVEKIELAQKILGEHGAREVEVIRSAVHFTVDNPEKEVPELVRVLVARDVAILAVYSAQSELEDIVENLSSGEVS